MAFCDLMRPVGRAIHQRDSTPLFPIVPISYMCVLALMIGLEPPDSTDLPCYLRFQLPVEVWVHAVRYSSGPGSGCDDESADNWLFSNES